MSVLDHNGLQTYFEYNENAGKPVLVLSNSLGTNLAMWTPQLQAFCAHFSLLRYDTRGHGQSSVPAGPYTLEQLGADVLSLLDHLGLVRVHFCGLSMGGMIGQWLGIHAPQRLQSLVLANTAAKIGTAQGWNTRIATVQQQGMQVIVPAVIERWFTAPFARHSPDVIAVPEAMLLATSPAGYTGNCAAIRDMDQRDQVSAIKARTLVIYGLQDQVTTPADAAFLLDHIAGSSGLALEAAHLSNLESPQSFSAGVLAFLR